ncbi:MAG: hypothetical protein Q8Q88_23150 [Phenylobacterium sp.]|uniref:hypothetical protein n=1 Tax=Phenylobacterium sp. TaxID=1871053 RepID=UPI002735D4EF|nr:hypothetical protein [Phenylobacterium sp.]MDP3749935.1 hypothetical protein [Phenylobacterium sp.]
MTIQQAAAGGVAGRGFWLGLAAYVLPSFPIAYVWHLVAFAPAYDALEIYRPQVIVPFGLISMLIQGAVFSFLYPRVFPQQAGSWLRRGLAYGAWLAVLSWSFTTLAVAAKHPMTSVGDFVALESSFTVLQFVVVGPLIALAHRR